MFIVGKSSATIATKNTSSASLRVRSAITKLSADYPSSKSPPTVCFCWPRSRLTDSIALRTSFRCPNGGANQSVHPFSICSTCCAPNSWAVLALHRPLPISFTSTSCRHLTPTTRNSPIPDGYPPHNPISVIGAASHVAVEWPISSPLLAEEGWTRHEENVPLPIWRGRGGAKRKPDAKRKRDSAQPQERAKPQ